MLFVWDITQSGLDENMQDEVFSFSSHGQAINTVFGLTSSLNDGTATITDISFYTRDSLVTRYPDMIDYLGQPSKITSTTLTTSHGIYTLNGQRIGEYKSEQEFGQLPKGIYIIDDKKRSN
jgi:hypothetical protein